MKIKIPRLWLIIPIGIFEYAVLLFCAAISSKFPNLAISIAEWANRTFPDVEWYFYDSGRKK